jgi:solute carrier family 13 (sodium-dependent dicarboxylate transporter), member 2/3/5
VAAILAASLLFLLPAGPGRAAMTWKEAMTIDWGTLLLFGGGMSLGGLLFETGLAEAMGQASAQALGLVPPNAVAGLSAALALFISELASNTASANVAVPIALSLAAGAAVPPLRPALSATFASSFGFILPVSTAPNALVYGTGRVPLRTMFVHGALLDASGLLAIWLGLAWLGGT